MDSPWSTRSLIVKSLNSSLWIYFFTLFLSLAFAFNMNLELNQLLKKSNILHLVVMVTIVCFLSCGATFLCAYSIKFAPVSLTSLIQNAELFIAITLDHIFIEKAWPNTEEFEMNTGSFSLSLDWKVNFRSKLFKFSVYSRNNGCFVHFRLDHEYSDVQIDHELQISRENQKL